MHKGSTQNVGFGLKGLHRTHYSAPSAGGGYHQHHHIYHTSYDGHGHSDHGGGNGKKRSIALSALTLLAFLFFLNILQNCLEEQMEDMNPQVIVMPSRLQKLKEASQRLVESTSAKISFDKSSRKADDLSDTHQYINVTLKTNSANNKKASP